MRSRSTPINLKILPATTRERSPSTGARKRARLSLLGSATPSVESMYKAKHGDYTLYTLQKALQRTGAAAGADRRSQAGAPAGERDVHQPAAGGKTARQYHRRPAVDPLSQPAGQQPVPCLRRVRRCADVPEVQRASDVSFRHAAPDVPLLRLLRTGARALPKVRRAH